MSNTKPDPLNAMQSALSVEDKASEVARHCSDKMAFDPGVRDILIEIHTVNDRFINHIYRLLTTGTATGRERVRIPLNMLSNYRLLMPSELVRSAYTTTLAKNMSLEAHKKWTCGNIVEELGIQHRSSSTIVSDPVRMENWMTHVDEHFNLCVNMESRNDAYWRGLAVLSLVLASDKALKANSSGIVSFIQWAGKHGDIADIVGTAMERKITDINLLRFILEEKSTLFVPLQSGSL